MPRVMRGFCVYVGCYNREMSFRLYYLVLYLGALACTRIVLEISNRMSEVAPNFLWYSPVHFLGGVCVGIFTLWLADVLKVRNMLALCLVLIAVIGIGWEIWEYASGYTSYPADTFDTFTDLVFDTLGALLGYRLFKRV